MPSRVEPITKIDTQVEAGDGRAGVRGGSPPDFLWSLVALAHLMRLSLLKAAHAAVGECHVAGNPGQPSYSNHVRESPRTWGTRPGDKAGEEATDLSHN